MTELQRCPRCATDLPIDAFVPSSRGRSGAYCRACHSAYNRDRVAAERIHRAAQRVVRCSFCNRPEPAAYARCGSRICRVCIYAAGAWLRELDAQTLRAPEGPTSEALVRT